MKHGVDSVALSAAEWRRIVVGEPDVVGSYGNGRFANTTAAKQAFPKAIHVQYDVNGSLPECDLLDIEPQDAVPADGPGWIRRHNSTRGPHPLVAGGLYCSASTVNEVVHDMRAAQRRVRKLTAHISNLLDAGLSRHIDFLVQSAHYGWRGGAHICGPGTCGFPQADSTQHADRGPQGQNTDLTLWADYCFGTVKPPDPDARYDLFDNTRRKIVAASERQVVEEYDRLRKTQTKTKHPQGPRLRLYVLRFKCSLLAFRLKRLGQPNEFHRGWRRRELQDRVAGKRLV